MRVRLAVALSLATALTASAAAPQGRPEPRVLVFSKTAAFRHTSIPAAVRAIRALGTRGGFAVDEDPLTGLRATASRVVNVR
jgi:hypothetical protein